MRARVIVAVAIALAGCSPPAPGRSVPDVPVAASATALSPDAGAAAVDAGVALAPELPCTADGSCTLSLNCPLQPLWQREVPRFTFPAVDPAGNLYAATGGYPDNALYKLGPDGRLRFGVPMAGAQTPFLVSGGVAYLVRGGTDIEARSTVDGRLLWSAPMPGCAPVAAAATAGGTLALLDGRCQRTSPFVLSLLDAATGALRSTEYFNPFGVDGHGGEYPVPAPTPLSDGRTFYFGDGGGLGAGGPPNDLRARAPDGADRWLLHPSLGDAPVAVGGGRLVTTSGSVLRASDGAPLFDLAPLPTPDGGTPHLAGTTADDDGAWTVWSADWNGPLAFDRWDWATGTRLSHRVDDGYLLIFRSWLPTARGSLVVARELTPEDPLRVPTSPRVVLQELERDGGQAWSCDLAGPFHPLRMYLADDRLYLVMEANTWPDPATCGDDCLAKEWILAFGLPGLRAPAP